jgi:hypothetical protein
LWICEKWGLKHSCFNDLDSCKKEVPTVSVIVGHCQKGMASVQTATEPATNRADSVFRAARTNARAMPPVSRAMEALPKAILSGSRATDTGSREAGSAPAEARSAFLERATLL